MVLQAAPLQMYGLHATVCAAGQLPAPSQPAASVATPPEHDGERQLVADPGKAHCVGLLPSHAPAHAPAPPHAGRLPTGAPVTFEQLPIAPARLHAWHWPLHALLQHTPSTQLLLWH